MNKPKIVFLDGYTLNPGDLSWQAFEQLGEFIVYDRTSRDQILERARDAEILIVNKTALRAHHFDALPKLRYIGLACTGADALDISAANARGIIVCNVPNYSTDSVAQMVFAYLLAVYTHVNDFAAQVKQGEWNRQNDFCFWNQPLIEIAGKRLGVIGLGNIGLSVARIASAMGMQVVAHTSKPQHKLPDYITKTALEDLYRTADVISLNCPYTADTHEMINAQTLPLMKPTAVLINTARGRLIDEQALANSLHAGHLMAYCADVLSKEPPMPNNPLLSAPRTILTPHIAWASVDARQRLIDICTDNIAAYLNGTPRNVISTLHQ